MRSRRRRASSSWARRNASSSNSKSSSRSPPSSPAPLSWAPKLPWRGLLPWWSSPLPVSALMPLSVVTQGLVHAALGGTLVSTTSTLLSILAWAAISLLLTLVASRGARRADRSEHVGVRAVPATA